VDDDSTGSLVRRCRLRAGLTQEELARKTGLGVRTIRDLESGRVQQPRATSVRLLAEALGVRADDLTPRPHGMAPPAIGSQLPADVSAFAARSGEQSRLVQLLTAPGAVPVAVVHGRPGVGKTALAVHVAHALRDRFPDGQLYARLGGGDVEPTDADAVLGRFLRSLGADGASIPPTLDERSADYRARLTDRRVLIVLDDARSEAQVRPLLPGTAGCAVLVTSRAPLPGLLGAGSVPLEVLDDERSIELLARIVGAPQVAAEPAAAGAIARACAGLPLALRIAGSRALATGTLRALADALADEGNRLDELTAGDVAVRASFAVGYRQLDGAGRRAYRLLGLLRAADVPAWAVAALLDSDPAAARAATARLIVARLVDEHGRGAWTRYRMHDLVRLDARTRAEAEDPAADRRAAVRRALDGWLHLAAEGDRRLPNDTMTLPEPPPAGWRPGPETTETLLAEPLDWFESERPALVHAVQQSVTEAPELTAGLVDGLIDFFATRYYPDDWAVVAAELHRSAQARGDRRLAGHALRRLAEVSILLRGDSAAAESLAREAVAECTAAGDPAGAGAARLQLGSILRFTRRREDSLIELRRARADLTAAGDPAGPGHVDFELGMVLASLGDHGTARRHFTAAEETLRRAGDVRGSANALTALSSAQIGDGEPAAAVASAREALKRIEGIGDRRLTAVTRALLGSAQLAAEDPVAARDTLRAALDAAEEVHAGDAEGMSSCELGEAYRRLGDLAAARDAFTRAAEQLRRAEMTHWVGRSELGLGRVAADDGDVGRARRHLEQARQLLEGSYRRQAETALAALG
jgi:transcriptional regulator with XRE-family HTH domain/tetratricopeptide (TPR) repeat protein